MESKPQIMIKGRYWLIAAVLGMALVLLAEGASLAASQASVPETPQPGPHYTVNDPADPGGADCTEVSCTLRAAITAARNDGLPGVHGVDFDLTYPVTITLSSPLPAITGTLVITGPGSENLAISGGGLYRAFEIGISGSLRLSGVAIRQSYDDLFGGGIYIDHGSLTLIDSLLEANLAGGGDGGGLYNLGGAVTISGTRFVDNDAFHIGGIANSGVMTVTNSLFSGNHARLAGAIDNSGVLTVTGSTFTGNIAQPVDGGAIRNAGVLTVANSTFTANGSTRGADIANNNGIVHVTNSTFYSATLPSPDSFTNTGISGTVTISNSILAAGLGIENCSSQGLGAWEVSADNLAADATCGGATVVTESQLHLGPLQDNGGTTLTIALLPPSAAIDAGDDAVCATAVGAPGYGAGGLDQRGVARPQGAHCDVGAFEQLPFFYAYLPLVDQ